MVSESLSLEIVVRAQLTVGTLLYRSADCQLVLHTTASLCCGMRALAAAGGVCIWGLQHSVCVCRRDVCGGRAPGGWGWKILSEVTAACGDTV